MIILFLLSLCIEIETTQLKSVPMVIVPRYETKIDTNEFVSEWEDMGMFGRRPKVWKIVIDTNYVWKFYLEPLSNYCNPETVYIESNTKYELALDYLAYRVALLLDCINVLIDKPQGNLEEEMARERQKMWDFTREKIH